MSELVVETPEGLSLRFEVAGAGARTAAGALDFVIWLLVTLVAAIVAFLVLGGLQGLMLLGGGVMLISLALYQILFGVFWNGQTPGKRVLGMRVADQSGVPASVGQHVLRGLFWPLEAVVLLVPLPLGVVLIAATARHQRLGDLVAGTVVLRDFVPHASVEPFADQAWSELEGPRHALAPALAARLDAADVDYLRDLLGRAELQPDARRRIFRSSARHYAQRLDLDLGEEASVEEAGELLREVYLYARDRRRAQGSSSGERLSRPR